LEKEMSKKTLIVVDMLNDFIDEKGALYCGPGAGAIVPFVRQRLEIARERGDLVIFLKDSHDENDKEFKRFPKHCVSGTWGNEIIPELVPMDTETVIEKKRYSGFYNTDLDNILAKSGIAAAEVVGVCTSICVMDTVGGLANRDYRITVPRDGVADFDAEFHGFALNRMEKTYGAEIA
jgi:nicotinamidase/pyrazinamidase